MKIQENTIDFINSIDSIKFGDDSICVALRNMLNAIKHFVPYLHANLWLVNPERELGPITFPKTLSLVSLSNNQKNNLMYQMTYTFLEIEDSLAGQTILEEKIIKYKSLTNERLLKNRDLVIKLGANSLISVPIKEASWSGTQSTIGVLQLYFKVLPSVSDQVLNFISHRISNAIEKLKTLHRDRVTTRLLPYSSGSLERQYKRSIKALENYGVEACSIFIYDKFRNKLKLVASSGIKGHEDEKLVAYELGCGLTGNTAKFKKSVIVHNLQCKRIINIHAGKYIEQTSKPSLSFMACPIVNKDNKLVGVIRCVNKYLNKVHLASFSQLDMNILERIADVLCQHMERSLLERTRESLLAKIPHDLKAPIVAVRNNAENIKKFHKRTGFNFMRKLDDIIDDCKIMFLLLQQIKRDNTYKYEKINLKSSVIVKLIKELRPMAISCNRRSLDYDDSLNYIPPMLYLDRSQMQHLFFNLLINAIKYSYDGTDIVVNAKIISNYIAVNIINWGVGIPDAYKEAIFEPEVRTPGAIDIDATGTGWGLSICQEIAEKHEGKIVLNSQLNPTIFTLYLPTYLSTRSPK